MESASEPVVRIPKAIRLGFSRLYIATSHASLSFIAVNGPKQRFDQREIFCHPEGIALFQICHRSLKFSDFHLFCCTTTDRNFVGFVLVCILCGSVFWVNYYIRIC